MNRTPHTYSVSLRARCQLTIIAPSPQAAARQAAQMPKDILPWKHVTVADVELQLKFPMQFCGVRQRDDFGREDLAETPNLNELTELKHAA